MRPTVYSPDEAASLIRRQKVATLPELMQALGTESRRTAFRKLSLLEYRTSYSHCGRFYTLDEVASFDDLGLWSYDDIWFSALGTLLDTAAGLVDESEFGHFSDELDNVLHVGTKDALRRLVRMGRLKREEVAGRFLYCTTDSKRRRLQVMARRARLAEPGLTGALPHPEVMPDELRAAIVLFFSLLNEKQRRLYAGLEALKTGHGGDARVAEFLGLDAGTVARGRRELLAQDFQVDRVRAAGGGRKRVEKKRPK